MGLAIGKARWAYGGFMQFRRALARAEGETKADYPMGTIARIKSVDGSLTEFPVVERADGAWQSGAHRYEDSSVERVTVLIPATSSPVVPAPTETGPKGTAAELREFAENLIADIENREPWTASQIAEHIEENFQ